MREMWNQRKEVYRWVSSKGIGTGKSWVSGKKDVHWRTYADKWEFDLKVKNSTFMFFGCQLPK